MKLLLDANRYTDATGGDPGVVAQLGQAPEIVIAVIVLGELRYGFAHGNRAGQNEANLTRFLAGSRVSIVSVDEATTHVYAQLMAQLRRRATPIPTNDVWIAALAVQHGLTLYTRDKHFDRLPQVPRI